MVYTLVRQRSPLPAASYTVLRWLAIPRLLTVTIGHFLLTFLKSLVALHVRLPYCFLQTASEPSRPGSRTCNTLASRPLAITIGYCC